MTEVEALGYLITIGQDALKVLLGIFAVACVRVGLLAFMIGNQR